MSCHLQAFHGFRKRRGGAVLAAAIGRDASELAGAALRGFLDENEQQMAAIDAGIAEADAGHLLDYEEVKASVQERLSALAKR